MAITWDKALYDKAYDLPGPGRRYGYERTVMFEASVNKAKKLVNLLGLDGSSRVVIFGCGFDWTGEALRSLGIDAIGSDTSSYIQAEWGSPNPETSSDKKPLSERGNNNGSRNKIKQEFAGNNDPTHVISENILTSLIDAEITDLAQWDNFTSAVVVHITTTLDDGTGTQQIIDFPLWNWKTDASWRTFFNSIGLSHHRLFGPSVGREF